jgi:glycosyl-4,4'-diaponeurosporenoate acyltransferase
MPLVLIGRPLPLVVVDIAAWALIHAGTGIAVHLISLRWLHLDRWLFRERAFEGGGSLYRDVMHINRWKDRLPEAGALLPGGLSKRALPSADEGGLPRFVAETRRAELGHWMAAAGGPLFALWNPPPIAAVMVLYGLAVNLPFIVIQRYNRIRVCRVLRSRTSRRSLRARSRSAEGTNGSNIPYGSPP